MEKIDITGQQRTVEVGNYIALSAVVTPKGFAPANGNYNWEIPPDVLKDYIVTKRSNPVVPLPNAERRRNSLSFFWLNGGSKDVRVTINVKGHQFQAITTFEVSRPENTITARVDAQPGVENGIPATPPPDPKPENPDGWILRSGFIIFQVHGDPPTGSFVWTQMLRFVQIAHTIRGVTTTEPPPDKNNGLDERFEYSELPSEANDAPEIIFHTSSASWAQQSIKASMYLMYISVQERSRYVPLRAIDWESQATANPNPPPPNPPNYSITADSGMGPVGEDRNETDPPNWPRIIKGKHKL